MEPFVHVHLPDQVVKLAATPTGVDFMAQFLKQPAVDSDDARFVIHVDKARLFVINRFCQ